MPLDHRLPPAPADRTTTPRHRSRLPTALRQAYAQARYEVRTADGAPAWCLQVGQVCTTLQAAYTAHAVTQAAYLTACNPRGRLCSEDDNSTRMAALRQALAAAGWSWAEGQGRDPQGLWPGEASVLVWGMDALQACAWARHWAQNAVLHCGRDACPRLLWLR